MKDNPKDRYLPPGTIVKHNITVSSEDYDPSDPSTWEEVPEYGVVVHCWFSPEYPVWDCHIAFLGKVIPNVDEEPEEKAYILRYSAMHLEVLHEAVHTPEFPAVGRKP